MKNVKYIIPERMDTIRVMARAISSITCPASVFIRNVLQLGRQMQFLGMNKGWQSNMSWLDEGDLVTFELSDSFLRSELKSCNTLQSGRIGLKLGRFDAMIHSNLQGPFFT